MAARIRTRATRRAGELLKQIDGRGGDRSKNDGGDTFAQTQKKIADRAGMSERQRVTAVRVANIPEADFAAQVDSDNPPTLTALAEQGKTPRKPLDPQSWLKGRFL
jgi:hypothetical protein